MAKTRTDVTWSRNDCIRSIPPSMGETVMNLTELTTRRTLLYKFRQEAEEVLNEDPTLDIVSAEIDCSLKGLRWAVVREQDQYDKVMQGLLDYTAKDESQKYYILYSRPSFVWSFSEDGKTAYIIRGSKAIAHFEKHFPELVIGYQYGL